MSLIRPVLRMCAVGALMNSTWAEGRVYDSDNTPLAEVLAGDTKPYIVVFTDDDLRPDVIGRDVFGATRNLTLILEFGVAAAIDGAVQIPATDAGMEATIDILETQAMAAMLEEPRNPWGELVRRMILRVVRMQSKRGGSAERGSRWAARQVTLVCDVISDPAPGEVMAEGHAVRDFVTLAEGMSPMLPAAQIIISLLNNSPAPEWRQIQAKLTLTKAGVQGIGEAPIIDDEIPSTAETITLEDENTGQLTDDSDQLQH